MKDYLNFEGLTHFFNKLIDKFVVKSELTSITNEEVDEICESVIYSGEEVEL